MRYRVKFASSLTLALVALVLLSGNAFASGGGGGGGGGAPVPSGCVAKITQFDNTPGYGKYSPYVGGIRTTLTVQNCTPSPVAWHAIVTYSSGWQTTFTCTLPGSIGGGLSGSCRVDNQYLSLNVTYQVTATVADSAGVILATASGSATTPSVPNPNTAG